MIVRLLKSVSLALSLCMIVAICCGCNQKKVTQADPEPQHSTSAWSNFNLTYGLNATEIQLDREAQATLVDFVQTYELKEITQEELDAQEAMYGGHSFRFSYTQDSILTTWTLTANVIIHTTSRNDTVLTENLYQADQHLLNTLAEMLL